MKQTLWIPKALPAFNEWIAAAKGCGGRGTGYARLKRELTNEIALRARAERLRPCKTPVTINFAWHENGRRDPDGFTSGGRKVILDGLVLARVLPNDRMREIAGWSDEWRKMPTSGVMVTLTDAP